MTPTTLASSPMSHSGNSVTQQNKYISTEVDDQSLHRWSTNSNISPLTQDKDILGKRQTASSSYCVIQRMLQKRVIFLLCYVSCFLHVYTSACIYHRGLLVGLDCGLSEHEVLVLGRQFSVREESEADVSLMLAVAQDHLRKKLFEEFPDLTRSFSYHDRHK